MLTYIIVTLLYVISVILSYFFARIYFRNIDGREKSLILAVSVLVPMYNIIITVYCLFILIDESPRINKKIDDFIIKVFRLDK